MQRIVSSLGQVTEYPQGDSKQSKFIYLVCNFDSETVLFFGVSFLQIHFTVPACIHLKCTKNVTFDKDFEYFVFDIANLAKQ